MKRIPDSAVDKFTIWMGDENLRWFKHLKGLFGTYSPVIKLNAKRKFIPVHPVHLREGMQVRNWMRKQIEFKDFSDTDFDDNCQKLVHEAISIYIELKTKSNEKN